MTAAPRPAGTAPVRAARGAAAALRVAALGAAACATGAAWAAGPVWVGRFADGLAGWREVRLSTSVPGNTFRVRDWDGVAAVEVASDRSMSLLARAVDVDLRATPVMCWRWRIDAPLQRADMATKAGDDYAARVYLSLRIPPAELGLALRAQLAIARAIWGPEVPDAALNYVWDNRLPPGTVRPNAYTGRAIMVVQRSGAADAGRWVWERRDVAADAARHFGASAAPAQVAVTADTDNTGESARAGFADLHFVARDAACGARGEGPR